MAWSDEARKAALEARRRRRASTPGDPGYVIRQRWQERRVPEVAEFKVSRNPGMVDAWRMIRQAQTTKEVGAVKKKLYKAMDEGKIKLDYGPADFLLDKRKEQVRDRQGSYARKSSRQERIDAAVRATGRSPNLDRRRGR